MSHTDMKIGLIYPKTIYREHTSNSIVQKTIKVVNLVKIESPMKPPRMESKKEVPMKLVTIFADVACG